MSFFLFFFLIKCGWVIMQFGVTKQPIKKKKKKKSQKVSAGEMIGLHALKVKLEDKEHLKTHQKTHQSGKIKKKNQTRLVDLNVSSCSFKWQTSQLLVICAFACEKYQLLLAQARILRNICEHQFESQKVSIDSNLIFKCFFSIEIWYTFQK